MAELSGTSGGPYDYVQTGKPTGADEGETWYDIDGNAAYVYDGANWVEQTVTDHSQLSGVGASAHHAKYTDAEALSAVETGDVARVGGGNGFYIDFNNSTNWAELVDGAGARAKLVTQDVYLNGTTTGWLSNMENASSNSIDADTVDGNHASDLGAPSSTGTASVPGAGWARDDRMDDDNGSTQTARADINIVCDGVRGNWNNNMSTNDSQTATLKAWDGSGTLVVDKAYTLADDETRTETVNITGTMISTVEAVMQGGGNQYGHAEVHSHKVGMPTHDHPI